MERLIFHVDVNSAYLSWEAARRVAAGEEDLRLISSAISGDPENRTGVILAKSIPAKKCSARTGEPVAMALRKCPHRKADRTLIFSQLFKTIKFTDYLSRSFLFAECNCSEQTRA